MSCEGIRENSPEESLLEIKPVELKSGVWLAEFKPFENKGPLGEEECLEQFFRIKGIGTGRASLSPLEFNGDNEEAIYDYFNFRQRNQQEEFVAPFKRELGSLKLEKGKLIFPSPVELNVYLKSPLEIEKAPDFCLLNFSFSEESFFSLPFLDEEFFYDWQNLSGQKCAVIFPDQAEAFQGIKLSFVILK